jgi:HNH endonuclease
VAISVTDWVFDHSRSRHGARLVLLAIAYYGEVVTISVRELGDMTLLGERAVRMAICSLVELGELAVEYNAGDSSRYRVLMIDREPEPLPPPTKRDPIPVKVRFFVFERDGYRCVQCGATEDLTIDHIYPRSLGGGHTEDNLQTLCRPCNCRKGARV